jgi:hypothetical protein
MIIGQLALVQQAQYQVAPPQLGVGNYLLLPGMGYRWRVRTSQAPAALQEDQSGWTEWSETRSFRTGTPSSATISPVSPVDRGIVWSRTPRLLWQDSNPRTFYYEVQLSQDPQFVTDPLQATAAVYWELVHGGQTSPRSSYQVRESYPLVAGTTYYWRVRPRVQGDGVPVAWSATWSFTPRVP